MKDYIYIDFSSTTVTSKFNPNSNKAFGLRCLKHRLKESEDKAMFATCPICHRKYNDYGMAKQCLERCRSVKRIKFDVGEKVWAIVDDVWLPAFVVGVCTHNIVQVCIIDSNKSGDLVGPILFRTDMLKSA